jgi:hypothetical protein
MAVQITDDGVNIKIVDGSNEFLIAKEGLSVNKNGQDLYFNGYEIKNYKIKYSDVSVPDTDDIDELLELIDGYLETGGGGGGSDPDAVKLTGDQTVAGVKTFSSSPIVPTPTTNTQASNKSYTDNTSFINAIILG